MYIDQNNTWLAVLRLDATDMGEYQTVAPYGKIKTYAIWYRFHI